MTRARSKTRKPREFWSPVEVEFLREVYPHYATSLIAAAYGKSINRINAKASQLGLKKTAVYLASPDACRLRRGDNVGARYRFPKGHVPANKGLRRPGWTAGRMAETQFKKGQKPHTWRPIGTEVVNVDGYLVRKMSDTGYPPRDWVPVHRLLWTKRRGPIPAGHKIVFKNGNKADIRVGNLELVTDAEMMRRNTVHNLPKPLVRVIQLRGVLNRKINARTRDHEEQDGRPAGPPIRRARASRRNQRAD